MASACNRIVNRTALASLKSAIKSSVRTPSLNTHSTSTSSSRIPLLSRSCTSSTDPLPRFSSFIRSPAQLGCVESLLPLHSVVAISRLTSCLSLNARNCRALCQDGTDGT